MKMRAVALGAALPGLAALGACGGDDGAANGATDTTVPTAASSGDATAYPLTVANCDSEITIDARPERVVLLEAAAVTLLEAVDALDTVVAKVGIFPPVYYSDAVNVALASAEELTSQQSSTGGVEISLEAIIDAEPDLVIGYETETITRSGLADAGIELYVMPPYCEQPPPVSFDAVYREVERFGELFDARPAAQQAATAWRGQVQEAAADPAVERGTTGAALYVSTDGSAIYAYSELGMVHPQMEALGLTNVFAELPERVPEISIEEVIDAKPEVLILLYTDPEVSPDRVLELVAGLPGAETIPAVAEGRAHPLLFNFSEPPSPLVIEGLARLQDLLAS